MFPPSEVDKVLGGLEILAKVFDQQSPPMVSKILQQVRGTQGHVVVMSPPPHPGGCPHRPPVALAMGTLRGGPAPPGVWG